MYPPMVKFCWKGVKFMNLFQMLMSLSLSDKIQIISIFTSSILSIVSVCIAIATLKQTNYIARESNRANIVVYMNKNRAESWPSIFIKNFGQSPGKVLNIEINPSLENSITSKKFITDYTDLFLAPNQSISTIVDIRNIDPKIFTINITYETLGKIYSESYTINFEYRSSVLYSYSQPKNTDDILKEINKSIREVSDKLD